MTERALQLDYLCHIPCESPAWITAFDNARQKYGDRPLCKGVDELIDDSQDDAAWWMNYRPSPSGSETRRMEAITGSESVARDLLEFGLRPLTALDLQPNAMPSPPAKPFEVRDEHLAQTHHLVDTMTGHRFVYDRSQLAFDPFGSDKYFDANALLMLAADGNCSKLAYSEYSLFRGLPDQDAIRLSRTIT